MKVHCLFEQSGTFKNEFIKLGIPAEDYDILNDFRETDHVIDLFKEIRGGYNGKPSIFDDISKDDLIMAFFPCTRFEDQIMLWFRGQSANTKGWSVSEKLEKSMELHNELHEMYMDISMLVEICLQRDLRLIIENPYSAQHYLRQYWCLKPAIIDTDRTRRGDHYKKPTQYYFVNCEPKHNFIFEPLMHVERKKCKFGFKDGKERSMIHPQYANRFIREFILDEQ